MATNVNVLGRVKFYNPEKGFGIIITKQGDVFIHVSKCGGKQAELVADAEVRIDFITTYKDGVYKHSATALLSVKAPPAPVEVLDTVKFYNPEKGFGFIFCGDADLSKGEAILRGHVAKQAGIVPGKGMPVLALVLQKPEGPEVVSFKWGPEVEAAYAAKLGVLHAEDGAAVDDVDALMAEHAAETQADIGQKPAVEANAETAAEAPVKPKRVRKKAAAKSKAPKKASAKRSVTIAEAAEEGLLDGAPEGTMAAQLAALGLKGAGKPNGAAVTAN